MAVYTRHLQERLVKLTDLATAWVILHGNEKQPKWRAKDIKTVDSIREDYCDVLTKKIVNM